MEFKFKVNQKVEVLSNLSAHKFDIGETIEIKYRSKEADGLPYYQAYSESNGLWCLSEEEIKN